MIRIRIFLFLLFIISLTSCNKNSSLSIDPALEGEWMSSSNNRLRHVFNSDSTYFVGAVGTPYYLENNGNTLNINNITYYTRQSGNPASIVGHWRDDPNGEEAYYRSDGRYMALFDNDPFVYYGTYSVAQGLFTNYEYRNLYETNGNQLIFHYLNSNTQVAITYSIVSNVLTMGGESYTKVP
ncbi:MAG: hypothetical protein HND53_09200 [Proteobacteria bacterium]|nr:hypothetical protein [Pseudomonadota bacterium]NOG60662.1 hypothetical protein [Pseudomonadota bacterium]